MKLHKLIEYLSKYCNLEYHIYSNEEQYHLPCSVMLKAKLNDQKYVSWGAGKDEDTAFFKAVLEMVERCSISYVCPLSFRENKIFGKKCEIRSISEKFKVPLTNLHPTNSNGTGVGFSTRFAITSAKMELIERHTILYALIKKIAPLPVVFNQSKYKLPHNYSLKSFYWRVGSVYVTVMVMIHPDGGMYFGTSARKDLKSSLIKSFEELSPSIIYSLNEDRPSDFSIIPGDLTSFSRYWRYSNDGRLLEFMMSGSNKHLEIAMPENIYFSRITIPEIFLSFLPNIVCTRVISPFSQQLFFDNWDRKYLNPILFKDDPLPVFPHFIA